MITAAQLHREKLREIGDLYRQKLEILVSDSRFSAVLADRIQSDASSATIVTQAEEQAAQAAFAAASAQTAAVRAPASSPIGDSHNEFDDIIAAAAEKYDLPESLIKALIRTESSFRPDAVSSAGAMGLMQLMPKTAEVYGVTDAFDPEQNIFAGSRYIRFQLDRFGDVRLALAAYNTGPSRIRNLKIENPDDPEQYERISEGVRGYVDKVLRRAEQYNTEQTGGADNV